MRKHLQISLLFFLSTFMIGNMRAAVVADFTSDKIAGCAPLTVNFTDASTGGPTSWAWTFGNGNTSILQNPSAVYNTPGVYSVTLVASNISSSSTKIKIITVYSNPIANFNVIPSPACVGKAAQFVSTSTQGSGAITSWSWDYGDGNNQTTGVGSASHSYSPSGSYPSSLIVTDANGCTSSAIKTVTVVAAPAANFTANPTASCTAPLTVNFTNTSAAAGGSTYSWTFGDGTTSTSQNPTHTYSVTGNFNVKLVITQGGCKDSIVKNNFVIINRIAADFSVVTRTVCANQPVVFTETSLPLSTSRVWLFGDGGTTNANNPSHTYVAAGVYSVTLIATDGSGCKDTIVKVNYMTVRAAPVANFDANITTGCSVPLNVTFRDSSVVGVAWTWDFGDGSAASTSQNPIHTYTTAGTYTVSLIVTNANGCTAKLTRNAYIFISFPIVDFVAFPLKGCVPLFVNFTSLSTSAADPIASYVWTFGDGHTGNTAIPTTSNTYTTQGIYNVKLKVITASGCADSVTKVGYVRCGNKPVANFSVTPTVFCYGLPTQFTDMTNSANEWDWLFGDGGTSLVQNPTYVYADTGTFDVRLIASMNGCPDTIIKTDVITVMPPIPRFNFALNCTNYYNVAFTNASAAADSVTWNFGDATSDVSNNNTPTHTYLTRGVKTVTLTAFNSTTNCSFFITHSFTIAEPIANFTNAPDPAKGCIPLPVGYNSSTSQDANTYVWSFPGGSPSFSSQANPSTTYLAKGIYNVSLTITDVNGCTNRKSVTNLVNALAVDVVDFAATPVTGCAPLNVLFSDSTVADSALTQWTWNWGDGTSSTISANTASHTYVQSGFYSVTLTSQDANSCVRSKIKVNYINPTRPVPSFSVDTFACRNEVITYDATASVSSAPTTYSWDFGDGTSAPPSASATTTHSYSVDAVYAVTLTVTDKNGCDSSMVINVRVEQPVASFSDSTLSYGCGTKQVKFTDHSTGFVTGWNWDFGNGAGSTLQDPTYTYTSPGSYTVTLIVTNLGGCTDTMSVDSVVVPGPVGSFSFVPSSGCVPLTVTFHATSINSDYFTWDFGDGTVLTRTLLTTVTHTYVNNINVTPILLLGDTLPNGQLCELPATNLTGNVVATFLFNVNVLPASPISITEEETIMLDPIITGNLTNLLSYNWSPSPGLSCTDCTNPILSGLGTNMQYVLTVTDVGAGGCLGYDTVDVIWVPCIATAIAPNVFTPNDDGFNDVFTIKGVCINTNYELTIFDRWGVEIFSAKQRRTFWDGRNTAGELMQDGVYYYVIRTDDTFLKGFVQLIR